MIKQNIQHKVLNEVSRSLINLPKLNPCMAIKALLTIISPTEVTTLNIHAATSNAAFLSALLKGAIPYFYVQYSLHLSDKSPGSRFCISHFYFNAAKQNFTG